MPHITPALHAQQLEGEVGKESGSRDRNRISGRRRSCHCPRNRTSGFEQMRIPLNTTSTAKTSTFSPGPSGRTLKEVSSAHAQGMHSCQVLYSQVFSSGAVGGSCSPCLLTWKPLLPVAQWLTFQWSPLMPGGVGGVHC